MMAIYIILHLLLTSTNSTSTYLWYNRKDICQELLYNLISKGKTFTYFCCKSTFQISSFQTMQFPKLCTYFSSAKMSLSMYEIRWPVCSLQKIDSKLSTYLMQLKSNYFPSYYHVINKIGKSFA